jgi:peptidoglycan hydrolase-like protein with peptidoglycan-binding domain
MAQEKLKPHLNTGVKFEPPKISDWKEFDVTGITYKEVNPSGNWQKYLPSNEDQFKEVNNKFIYDTESCVTFSGLNCIEIQVDFMIQNNLISATDLQQLKAWGYIDANGHFNCSDHFSAIVDGTTTNGNWLPNFWDSVRKYGLLPQGMDKAPSEFNTVEEWLDPKGITQTMKDFALNILKIFNFNYSWVIQGIVGDFADFEKHLKQAPLHIASPTCSTWSDGGIVASCDDHNLSHATTIFAVEINQAFDDYDHYPPYQKRLAWNYYLPYALKGVVTLVANPTPFMFTKDLSYPMRNNDVLQLQIFLQKQGFFNVTPTGYFGTYTKSCLINFQKANGIDPIGVCGPATRAFINKMQSPNRTLEDVIIQVESGGNDNAIGDKGLKNPAYGAMQIRQPVCDDVNKKFGTSWHAQDCLGNRAVSVSIFQKYISIYQPNGTNEQKARLWNGGPNFASNPQATDGYWSKVSALL